jgi:ABC-type multidrug transport system ATPase subunit
MQNDQMLQTMTVRETLEFAADLKLNKTADEKKKIVMQLARHLKLEKCIDTLVGGVVLKGISGG